METIEKIIFLFLSGALYLFLLCWLYVIIAAIFQYRAKRLGFSWAPSNLTMVSYLLIIINVIFVIPMVTWPYRYHPESKHRGKNKLLEIHKAQHEYFKTHGKLAGGEDCFAKLGLDADDLVKSYHSLFCGDEIISNEYGRPVNLDNIEEWPLSIKPRSTDESCVVMAIMNRDKDEFLDVIMISEEGEIIQLLDDRYNTVNDLKVIVLDDSPMWNGSFLETFFGYYFDFRGLCFFVLLICVVALLAGFIKDFARYRKARKNLSINRKVRQT